MLATLLSFSLTASSAFATPFTSNSLSQTNTSVLSLNLTGEPQCFPEHEYPLPADYEDCNDAAQDIVGTRNPTQAYLFTHHQISDHYYYHLPQFFSDHSCGIYLDLAYSHRDDQDTVPVGIVEGVARYLAYKCAGGFDPDVKFGGSMTVGWPGRDFIDVVIYGKVPRSGGGAMDLQSRVKGLVDHE